MANARVNLSNCKHRIGFCASVARHTNFSQLQIQAVVQAGQATFSFSS